METKIFRGLEKETLPSINDEKLKKVLFSPTWEEFLKVGGAAFLIILILSLTFPIIALPESFSTN